MPTKLKPEAIALLLKVKEKILEEPLRIRMDEWVSRGYEIHDLVADEQHAGEPPCGTVACIAGWTALVGLKCPERSKNLKRSALRLLGLHVSSAGGWISGSSHELFHPESWPDDLKEALPELSGTPEYAAVVAKAIDRFIANPAEFEEA